MSDLHDICRHCRSNRIDDGQPETNLCAECLDAAVWGAECPFCNKVPTGNRGDRCDR